MTVLLEFTSAKEALHWCMYQCPHHRYGCATLDAKCELRMKWHIPPFGRSYPC